MYYVRTYKCSVLRAFQGARHSFLGRFASDTGCELDLTTEGDATSACTAKLRNPRHFDTIEGGRVHQTLLGAIQYVKAIYSSKTTVSDTFWRPGGV